MQLLPHRLGLEVFIEDRRLLGESSQSVTSAPGAAQERDGHPAVSIRLQIAHWATVPGALPRTLQRFVSTQISATRRLTMAKYARGGEASWHSAQRPRSGGDGRLHFWTPAGQEQNHQRVPPGTHDREVCRTSPLCLHSHTIRPLVQDFTTLHARSWQGLFVENGEDIRWVMAPLLGSGGHVPSLVCLLLSLAVVGNAGPAFISTLPGVAGPRCGQAGLCKLAAASRIRPVLRGRSGAVTMQAGGMALPDEDGWYDSEQWESMGKSPARRIDPVGKFPGPSSALLTRCFLQRNPSRVSVLTVGGRSRRGRQAGGSR